MKKLMLSSLVLLPLILLLILSTTTAAISITSHIYVESMQFVDEDKTLYLVKDTDNPNPSYELKLNIFPLRASNKEVTYESLDESIATVNQDGIVSAVNYGITYIRAYSNENQELYVERKVVVTDIHVHELIITNPIASMVVGDEHEIECDILPKEANNQTLLYTTSDDNVCSVSLTGVILAKNPGTATITVTSQDSQTIKQELYITVYNKLENATVEEGLADKYVSVNGEKFPAILLQPKDAVARIRYSSSNEEICTIDVNGNISFKKAGEVILTASINEGQFVFNKKYIYTEGHVNGVHVNCKHVYDYELLDEDKHLDILLTTVPNDMDLSLLDIFVENTNVVNYVNGEFIAVGGGSTSIIITFKKYDGTVEQVTTPITINRKAQDIDILFNDFKTNNIFTLDNTFEINALPNPVDATYDITFETASEGVQIVNNKVIFNNLDEYKVATIKATTNDGELEHVFNVIYINDTLANVYEVNKETTNITISMPKAIDEQEIKLVFYHNGEGVNKHELLDDYKQNIEVIKILETGVYTYTYKENDVDFSTINVTVVRDVEDITDLTVKGIENSLSYEVKGNKGEYYLASQEIELNYCLYPENTTNTNVLISTDKNCDIIGNKIIFNEAGIYVVKLTIDNVVETIKVKTTCGKPDSNIKLIDNVTLNKGDVLEKSSLIKEMSPVYAKDNYISFAVENGDMLKLDGTKFIAQFGGNTKIKVEINTNNGIINKEIVVNILEEPTSIDLSSKYIVVNDFKYQIKNDFYKVLPETANINNEVTLSSSDPNISINNDVISASENGIYSIELTLSNGIKDDITIVFCKDQTILNVSTSVCELPVGSTFAVQLPTEVAKNYSTFTNINGLTYHNGIFTLNNPVISSTDEYSASFMVGENQYKFKGYVESEGINVELSNMDDCEKDNLGLVTGLKALQLNAAITNADATYKNVSYESMNDVAVVDSTGLVTFIKAGTAIIKVTSIKEKDITNEIKIRSTFGYIERLSTKIDALTINYDLNEELNLIDYIEVFPKQADKNITSIKLQKDNDNVLIDGLTIKGNLGGKSIVKIQTLNENGEYVDANIINVTVNKSATEIWNNGELLNTDKTISIHEGLYKFNFEAKPIDSNINNTINCQVVSGGEYAIFEQDYLLFSEENKPVVLNVTMGELSYNITVQTDSIVAMVNVDKDVVIMPYESNVVFYSDLTSDVIVDINNPHISLNTNSSVGSYKADCSFIGEININGVTKQLIVTKGYSQYASIKVEDYNNEQKQLEKIVLDKNLAFETASKEINIEYVLGNDIAYNKDKSKVQNNIHLKTTDIATIVGNKLIFNKPGSVVLIDSIDGEDYYGIYHYEQNYTITSTYGLATQFAFNMPSEITDQENINIEKYILVEEPKYGGDSINYIVESNDIFSANMFDLQILETGIGVITISSTNGVNTSVETKTVNVNKNIDQIIIKDINGTIKNEVINTNTYKIMPIAVSNNNLTPNILNYNYSVVVGNASVDELGVVTFTSTYEKATIKISSQANDQISYLLDVINIPSDIKIIDIKDIGNNCYNTFDKYVIVNKYDDFKNLMPTENIEVINNDFGTFKFNHGGKFSYQTSVYVVEEKVDAVNVSKNSLLIAENQVDIAKEFVPTMTPSTAYNSQGAIKLEYVVMVGNDIASLSGSVLTFSNQGKVTIKIIADDKYSLVEVESTLGFVKDVTWNQEKIDLDFASKEYDILQSLYTVTPVGYIKENIVFESLNSDIFNVNGTKVTFNKGGSGILKMVAKTSATTEVVRELQVNIHNPVTKIGFNYNYNGQNYDVNKILVGSNKYQLSLNIDKDSSLVSPYDIQFISLNENILTVDHKGLVTFKTLEQVGQVKVVCLNSDGTEVNSTIDLSTTNKEIIVVVPNLENKPIALEYLNNYVLYVVTANNNVTPTITCENKDVLDVNKDGVLNMVKSGRANVHIVLGDLDKIITFDVHKVSTAVLYNDQIISGMLTAKTSFDINPVIEPLDSVYGKTINYIVTGDAAVVENNTLKFSKAGIVNITIQVLFGDVVECTNTFSIESTNGLIKSFELKDNLDSLHPSYIFEDAGSVLKLKVENILPTDYALNGNITLPGIDSNIFDYQIQNEYIIFTTKNAGEGHVTIKIDNVEKRFDYISKLKVKDITVAFGEEILNNGNAYSTMQSSLKLNIVINPLNAYLKGVNVTINNGGSYDSSTGMLSLPQIGKYDVKLISEDKNANFSFTVNRISDINNMTLHYKDKSINNVESTITIYPSAYEKSIVLSFADLPEGFLGNIDMSLVNITTNDNITFIKQGNEISLQIPTFTKETPTFDGSCKISLNDKTINVNIIRDGIEFIDFEHTNQEDENCGLQQIRVYGKRSYYNGQLCDYYKMPLTIEPAKARRNLKFTTSDPLVNVTYDNDFAYIKFGSFRGNSVEDAKNDIFDRFVTVNCSDASGAVNQTYNFHVVEEAVNVFDQDGFVNNNKVVLHVNLGNESELANKNTVLYTHPNASRKDLVYGNGNFVNFWAYADPFKPSIDSKTVVNYIGTSFNAIFRGGTFDNTKNNYHLTFSIAHVQYCEISQCFKGIFAGNGVHIKNCIFKYIKDMSIQISDQDKNVYVENIISIDGGNAALECQKNAFYLKGFIDIYNFKNKKMLKDLTAGLGTIADNLLKKIKKIDGGKYVYIDPSGDAYINSMIYSGKGGNNADRHVYFWNGTEYVSANEGNEYTAKGIKGHEVNLIIQQDKLFTSYVYEKDGSYLTYEHQHDYDYLATQRNKLKRTKQA